jgi:plastocyanin
LSRAATALLLALAIVPLAPAIASPAPLAAEVHIENFAFNPQTIHVLQGESITWDNRDGAPHTVTANDGSFHSGNLNQGQTYTRAFPDLGTTPYHCAIHPSMTGTVVVSDPQASPDLVVGTISFVDTTPGLVKRVDVQVRNLGQGLAGASVLEVAYLYQGQRLVIGTAEVPALGPDSSAVASVHWDTRLKVGDFDLRALADATGAVAEDDEANNEGRAVASVLVTGVPGVDLRDPL